LRIYVRGGSFVDERGRVRAFHGINVVCKDRSLGYVYKLSGLALRRLRELGFNVVRLGVIWDGLEPEPGLYDEEYLGRLEEQVEAFTEHGMYVVLDMHQDLYSVRYSDGAPEWATITDGLPEPGGAAVWSDAYMSPAVQRAFDHFWANDPAPDGRGLQDHFIECWRLLARRFGGRPGVLGYDLLNEPFPGSAAAEVYRALLLEFSRLEARARGGPPRPLEELLELYGDLRARAEALRLVEDEGAYRELVSAAEPYVRAFETEVLVPFYERVAEAIRSETPHGVIFLEDCYFCNAGVPSSVAPVRVGGRREPLQAYAPHVYDLVVDTPYIATHASEKRVRVVIESKRRAQERLGAPVLVGEWGAFGPQRGIGRHCTFLLNAFDELKWSWTYWAWWDGFLESEAARLLARPYPAAVAGELVSYGYDELRGFRMEWVADPSLKAPTVVQLPRGLEWGEVSVEPQCSCRVVEEDGAPRVEVTASRPGRHVLVIR